MAEIIIYYILYVPGLEVLACSINTNLHYYTIYSNGSFEPAVMLQLIILCIWEEQKASKSGVSGRLEIPPDP